MFLEKEEVREEVKKAINKQLSTDDIGELVKHIIDSRPGIKRALEMMDND